MKKSRKHIVSPATATQIHQDLGIKKSDFRKTLRALQRVKAVRKTGRQSPEKRWAHS